MPAGDTAPPNKEATTAATGPARCFIGDAAEGSARIRAF